MYNNMCYFLLYTPSKTHGLHILYGYVIVILNIRIRYKNNQLKHFNHRLKYRQINVPHGNVAHSRKREIKTLSLALYKLNIIRTYTQHTQRAFFWAWLLRWLY